MGKSPLFGEISTLLTLVCKLCYESLACVVSYLIKFDCKRINEILTNMCYDL